jgi:hypothetical protein
MVPAVALKLADVEPAGADTVAGTVSAGALLERLIVAPPVGAAFDRVTEQTEVAPESRLVGEQETELIVGLTTKEIDELLELPL